MMFTSLIAILAALLLAPLSGGLVVRTKAKFAGRRGPPVAQRYWDLWKLLQKSSVYSTSTTWIFRASPIVGLATALVALTMVPLGVVPALISFHGDLFVIMGMLALGRFFTMLAALDTGSPFEGMGASREAHFGALAEPVALGSLAALAHLTGETNLTAIMQRLHAMDATTTLPVLVPTVAALAVVYLVENSRMPVDDPTTHLELTMIHEVMILDHSGVDLAFIEYGASLKQWLLGALLLGPLLPVVEMSQWASIGVGIGCIGLLSFALGVVESSMARLRLLNVPGLILGAGAAVAVAFLLASMVLTP